MAIIVTMTGETFKRYQVCEEDEELFESVPNGSTPNEGGWGFSFQAQAIRGRGAVDESVRSLNSRFVTKVTRK